MTEYVYKLKNGELISAYSDEKGNISITKETLEIIVNSYNNGYQKGYSEGCLKGRTDGIDECLVLIDKIMPPQPYLLKSKHYENWKMKTTELRMLRDMIEQLKEKK